MYKIFADDLCIYTDVNNMDMFRLVSPELDLADNASGTLTMTLPPSNVGYDKITRLVTKIKVTRNDAEIWCGRVIQEEVDFWKNKKLTCEGELGYLNDTLQPQKEWEFSANSTSMVRSFLADILSVHNSKVSSDKQFTLGTVTVTDPMENEDSGTDEYYDDVYVYTDYETTLSCISTKLVDKLGGHLRVRKQNGVRYLDYLKDLNDSSTQTIQFGWNLMDFVTNYDETDFCTVLIPLGERYSEGEIDGLEGYLDISEVNGGKNYVVNQEALNNFGWIERVENFDDVTEASDLLKKGKEFLSDVQFGKMVLEISAVDLSYYEVNYDEINLLDQVRVKSIPHGLDKVFPVTEMNIPLDNPGNSQFTLGLEGVNSLSGLNNSISKTMGNIDVNGNINVLNNAPILSLAKHNAKVMMDMISTGFITIVTEKNDKSISEKGTDGKTRSDALYISNLADYEASSQRWRWNIQGLAYEVKDPATGAWKDPEVAITMDGSIVANFINVGVLNADIIKAGVIQTYDYDPATNTYTPNNNVVFDLTDGTLKIRKGEIDLGRKEDGSFNFVVDNDGNVKIQQGSINLGNGTFVADNSGKVAISSGSISLGKNDDGYNFVVTDQGVVTLNRGKINIANNFIVTDKGVVTIKDGNIVIKSGSIKIGSKFTVTSDGDVTIKDGDIAIKKGEINLGNGKFVVGSDGSVTIKSGTISIGNNFSVDKDGNLTTKNITATGGSFSNIAADSMTIEGSTLKSYLSISEGNDDGDDSGTTGLNGKINKRIDRVKNWVRNHFVTNSTLNSTLKDYVKVSDFNKHKHSYTYKDGNSNNTGKPIDQL